MGWNTVKCNDFLVTVHSAVKHLLFCCVRKWFRSEQTPFAKQITLNASANRYWNEIRVNSNIFYSIPALIMSKRLTFQNKWTRMKENTGHKQGGKSCTARWALLHVWTVAFASQTRRQILCSCMDSRICFANKEANPLLLYGQSHLLRKQGGLYDR